ncbi:nicotinamide riboside transporter PnuC [Brevibacillus aydinogluensis]|uniref:phage holin family protein n=1 Tax=Brevibacillus aydinogluensis TaxID=927786 RepID=UPI002892C243|nr:phage holin family protein [Brevibacillus aydinogluensis]MDT3416189.1 nicotinamide riboside transporter PnuC [Brevibacillus aydinogluensis]
MNETDLLTLAKHFLLDQALIVVAALVVIGIFLKKTPKVEDWLIPWILTGVGIVLACGVLGEITVQATIQGILAAGIANLGHQLWKQTTERRKEDEQ